MNTIIESLLRGGLRENAVSMSLLSTRYKNTAWVLPLFIVVTGFFLHAWLLPSRVATKPVLGGAIEVISGEEGAMVPAVFAVAIGEEATPLIKIATAKESLASATLLPIFKQMPVEPDELQGRTVLPGETLASIAESENVSIKDLKRVNPGMVEPLIVGDAIVIPANKEQLAQPALRAGSYLPEGFIWPAPGPLSQPHGRFSARDIPNALGTPVVASGDGIVRVAEYGWNGGYGNRVILDHPLSGVQTLYSHLKDFVVSPNEVVVKGQVIGYMGSTGHSTGPHVHFEVRP